MDSSIYLRSMHRLVFVCTVWEKTSPFHIDVKFVVDAHRPLNDAECQHFGWVMLLSYLKCAVETKTVGTVLWNIWRKF